MKKIIPVIITCDIDPTPEVVLDKKREALDSAAILFDRYGIKATYFFVANLARNFNSEIKELLKYGNEIGCHGLEHGVEEEYNRMPEDVQRKYLITATKKLEDLTGNAIHSFRGPMVKTSYITQQILDELDYWVDSSVCSQRIDFISSNMLNLRWIFAPRIPYHPSNKSVVKKGKRKLWVVPVSALVFPFISSTLYSLGIGLMKPLFNILYHESVLTGKPIVYLMHPVEFAQISKSSEQISMRGFYLRRRLKLRVDENKRFEYTNKLINYIASFPYVQFMTLSSYVKSHLYFIDL